MASVSTILKNIYAAKKPPAANSAIGPATPGSLADYGKLQGLGSAYPGSITGGGLNWSIPGGNTANAATRPPAPAPAPASGSTPGAPVDKSKLNPATGLPWDSQYESTVGGINRDRDFNLGNLDFDWGKTKNRLGFDDAGNFDPTNPFSRAALLKRSFDQRKDFTTNSMAARGQLYSGAIGRARTEDQFGYDTDYNSLQGIYDDAFQAFIRGRTGVTNAAATGVVTAQGEAIARAPAADPATSPNIFASNGGLNWIIPGGNTANAATPGSAPAPKKKKK